MQFFYSLKHLQFNLDAIQWTNYILDGIVLLVIIGFAIYCGRRGFIDCFFSFASTTVSIIAAVALAKVCVDVTNGWFGLDGVLEGAFTNAFAKLSGFDLEISAEGAESAIKAQNVPAIIAQLVFRLKGEVPEGTTIAMALGGISATLTCYIITAVLLFVVCKLLLLLTRGLLNELMDRVEMLDKLNTILGVVVGVVECLVIVCTLLSVLTIIPVPAIAEYLENTLFIGLLYKYNPLVWMFGLMI